MLDPLLYWNIHFTHFYYTIVPPTEAKFGRRLKAAGLRKAKAAPEVIDVEAAPRELVDSPQRAPSANKARHTPPASRRCFKGRERKEDEEIGEGREEGRGEERK